MGFNIDAKLELDGMPAKTFFKIIIPAPDKRAAIMKIFLTFCIYLGFK